MVLSSHVYVRLWSLTLKPSVARHTMASMPNNHTPLQRDGRRLMAPERTPVRTPLHTSRELNLSGGSSAASVSRPRPVIVVGFLSGGSPHRPGALTTKVSATPPRSVSAASSVSHHGVPVASDAIPHSSLMSSVPGHIIGSDPWEDEDDMPLSRRYSHRVKMVSASREVSAHRGDPNHAYSQLDDDVLSPPSAPSSVRSSVSGDRHELAATLPQQPTTASAERQYDEEVTPYAAARLRTPPGSTIIGYPEDGERETSNKFHRKPLPAPSLSPPQQRRNRSPARDYITDAGPWSILYNDETTVEDGTGDSLSRDAAASASLEQPQQHYPILRMEEVRRENDVHHLTNDDLRRLAQEEDATNNRSTHSPDANPPSAPVSSVVPHLIASDGIAGPKPIVGSKGRPIGASPERMRRSRSGSPNDSTAATVLRDALLAQATAPLALSGVMYDCDTSSIAPQSAADYSSLVRPRTGFTRRQCADKEDEDFLKDAIRGAIPPLPPADAHLSPELRIGYHYNQDTSPNASAISAAGDTDNGSLVGAAHRLSDQRLPLELHLVDRNTSTDVTPNGQVVRGDSMHLGPRSNLTSVDFSHSPEGRKHREMLTYHEPTRSPGGARQMHDPSSPEERLPQPMEVGFSTSPRKDQAAYFRGDVDRVALFPQRDRSPSRSDSRPAFQYGPPVASEKTKQMYEAFAGPEAAKEYPPDLMLWRMMAHKVEEERAVAAAVMERLEQRRREREEEERLAIAAVEEKKKAALLEAAKMAFDEPQLGAVWSQNGEGEPSLMPVPIRSLPTHTSVTSRERASVWSRPPRDANRRRLSGKGQQDLSVHSSSVSSVGDEQPHEPAHIVRTRRPSSVVGSGNTSSSRRVEDELDLRYGPLPPDKAAEVFDRLCQSPSRFVIEHASVSPTLKRTAAAMDEELEVSWSTRGQMRAQGGVYQARTAAMRCIVLESILTNCEATETAMRYQLVREYESAHHTLEYEHSTRHMQHQFNHLQRTWEMERRAIERDSARLFGDIHRRCLLAGHQLSLLHDLKGMIDSCQADEGRARQAAKMLEIEEWATLMDRHRGGKFTKLLTALVEEERVTRGSVMRSGYLAHMAIFDDERRGRHQTAVTAWSHAQRKRTTQLLEQLQEAEHSERLDIHDEWSRMRSTHSQSFLRGCDAIESRERTERDLKRQVEEMRRRLLARQREERASVEHDEGRRRGQLVGDEHSDRIRTLRLFDQRYNLANLEGEERMARGYIMRDAQPTIAAILDGFRGGIDGAVRRQRAREDAEQQERAQRELEAKARRSRPFIGFALAEKVTDGRRAGETSAPAAVAAGAQPHLVVDALFVGGPAFRQGLRLNDIIVSIAGEPALSLAQVRLTIAKRAVVGSAIEVVVLAPAHNDGVATSGKGKVNTSIGSEVHNLAASGTFGLETTSNGTETPPEGSGRRSPVTDANTSIQSKRPASSQNSRPQSPLRTERTVLIPVMTADTAFASLSEWFFDITKHHQVTREMDNSVVLRSVRSFVSKQNTQPSVSPDSVSNEAGSPTNRLGSSFRGGGDSLMRSGSHFVLNSDDDEVENPRGESPPFRPSPLLPTALLPTGKPPLPLTLANLGSPTPSGAASPTATGPVKRGSSSGRLGKGASPQTSSSFRRA